MKKLCTFFMLSALFATTAVAQDDPTVITQPAAGDTINLYRTTTGFESVYYYGIPHKSTGDWQRLVFGNDGAVYLENPLNSLYTKTWIKGVRAEGDTISFQLPQAIYSEEDFSTGEPKYGFLYRIHAATKDGKETFVPNEIRMAQRFALDGCQRGRDDWYVSCQWCLDKLWRSYLQGRTQGRQQGCAICIG